MFPINIVISMVVIQECQMTVHLFGAASSPSCCNFALKQTTRDTELTNGPLLAETIRRNFYVDDCPRSVEDEQTAIEVTQGLSGACAHGGFNLTKFITAALFWNLFRPRNALRKPETSTLALILCLLNVSLGCNGAWNPMSSSFV